MPDYCGTLDERNIQEHTFDILFAFDEVIAAGYKEKVTLQQIKTFTEMDSHEERIHEILESVCARTHSNMSERHYFHSLALSHRPEQTTRGPATGAREAKGHRT